MDEDLDEDDVDIKVSPPVDHESDDEIIESDIELEGEVVEADNDPPQKVNKHENTDYYYYFSTCISSCFDLCRWEINLLE